MSKSEALVYRLQADKERLQKDLDKAKRSLGKFQNQSKGISGAINKSLVSAFSITAGVALLQQGFSKVQQFIGESLKLFDTQEQAIAQVEAGLKATGATAGRTLGQLKKQASELQEKTIFGDEDILKNATAQLLTFTNIAGTQFDRTQKAALDLSTRLDGDLKSASIQLGKALNDPVANLSALSRSGIQFSKEQTKVIKELANTNRLAEAQTIILDELEKQYGGSAEAAAQAGLGGFKQLSNSIGDLKEEIGKLVFTMAGGSGGLLETFKNVVSEANEFVRVINSGATFAEKLAVMFGKLNPATWKQADELEKLIIKQEEDNEARKTAIDLLVMEMDRRKRVAQALKEQIAAFNKLKAISTTDNRKSRGVEAAAVNMPRRFVLDHSMFRQRMQEEADRYKKIAIPIINEINAIQQQLANAFSGFGVSLGTEGFASAIKQAGASIISVMGDQLIKLGTASKAMSALLLTIKKSLFKSPELTLAASIAAIGVGIALKATAARIQSSGFGGIGGSGGGGSSGPSGSFQSSLQGQSIQLAPVEFKLMGSDLYAAVQEQERRKGRGS